MGLIDDLLAWFRGDVAKKEDASSEIAEEPIPRALPPAPKDVKPEPAKPAPRTFGVENAIALMKKLPLDDEPELVLRVVRKTLMSIGVSIDEVVSSAKKREDELAGDIGEERRTIEELEREIAQRKKTIDAKLTQMKETHDVRSRLQEALASESKVGPLLVSPAEIARLQAEGAARAAAAAEVKADPPKVEPKPEPKIEPKIEAKPTPPPPKVSGSPPAKPSEIPKPSGAPRPPPIKSRLPPIPPRKASVPPPAVTPTAPPLEKSEKVEKMDALPSVVPEGEEDDPFGRTTARWEIDSPPKKSD